MRHEFLRRSTSAGLYDGRTKERLGGSGGWHVYTVAANGSDIERALKTLHERLWLAGTRLLHCRRYRSTARSFNYRRDGLRTGAAVFRG